MGPQASRLGHGQAPWTAATALLGWLSVGFAETLRRTGAWRICGPVDAHSEPGSVGNLLLYYSIL